MAEKSKNRSNGAMKKGVAYYQTDWVTKVMANGHSPQAKLIFMRIASFGERGCWMNNETLQEEYNRCERTIRKSITSLWSKGDIIVTGWNGHGRKMYAAGHPKVKPEINRQYLELKAKGKIESREQFAAKVRMRLKAVIDRVKEPEEQKEEKEHVIRGLAWYRQHTEGE